MNQPTINYQDSKTENKYCSEQWNGDGFIYVLTPEAYVLLFGNEATPPTTGIRKILNPKRDLAKHDFAALSNDIVFASEGKYRRTAYESLKYGN